MFALRLCLWIDYNEIGGKTLFVSKDRYKIEEKYQELVQPYYENEKVRLEIGAKHNWTEEEREKYWECSIWLSKDGNLSPEWLFIDEVEEI